jgi:hypothetical protein
MAAGVFAAMGQSAAVAGEQPARDRAAQGNSTTDSNWKRVAQRKALR